ncbi:MAG: TonB-dependent receptor plug domain-containing protein, partial [Negativicoccus succinicivorans]
MNKLARRQAALLAMCCLGCMTAVAADAPVYDIGDIVVTATRTQNTTKEVPAATQVIDGENIRQSGATNIREALSYFTNIMQTRIAHGGHDVMIRGMDTNKSLILVDGRKPANESSSASLGTARAMERINLQQVERIEILRGPSSALYGSDAMGGVINIITKKSTSPSGSISGEYASTGHTQWVHYDTGRQGKLAATVGARLRHTDRDTIEGEQWSEYFGNDQTYNLALDYYFADANKLTFTADYYH